MFYDWRRADFTDSTCTHTYIQKVKHNIDTKFKHTHTHIKTAVTVTRRGRVRWSVAACWLQLGARWERYRWDRLSSIPRTIMSSVYELFHKLFVMLCCQSCGFQRPSMWTRRVIEWLRSADGHIWRGINGSSIGLYVNIAMNTEHCYEFMTHKDLCIIITRPLAL